MWFLKGLPKKVILNATITSLPVGYQNNKITFSVQSTDEKLAIAIPFPWAPNKVNGGLTVNNSSFEYTLVENLKDLRNINEYQMMRTNELIDWHLDDIGVFTFWILPEKEYIVDYTHKIAADSRLFFPTRLPSLDQKPIIEYKLTVINGLLLDLPKYLIKALNNEFEFKDWAWDDDTRIQTENWLSSDDEDCSSSEDEN